MRSGEDTDVCGHGADVEIDTGRIAVPCDRRLDNRKSKRREHRRSFSLALPPAWWIDAPNCCAADFVETRY